MRQQEISELGAADAIKYLEGKVCSKYEVGYDGSIRPAQLKETRVYFVAPGAGLGGAGVGMDPKFLMCFQRFMQAAERRLNVCISAALRTAAHQQASADDPRNTVVCGRFNPIGNCTHVRGIAIDINELNGRYSEAHQLASSMGLRIPLPVADKWHIQAGGPCGTPDFSNPVPQTLPAPNQTQRPVPNQQAPAARPAPAPQPAPAQTTPAPAATTPAQQTCTPQFTCTNGVMYYQTSACAMQQYQVCANGCSGNICAVSTTGTSLVSDFLTKTPTTTVATTTRQATSTFDLIGALAGGTGTKTNVAPVATSVNLSGLSGQGVAVLQGGVPVQLNNPAANNVYSPTPTSQETFRSGDLAQSPGAQTYSPQQLSTFQSILANLKTIVLRILDYLRPFGVRASQQSEDHED